MSDQEDKVDAVVACALALCEGKPVDALDTLAKALLTATLALSKSGKERQALCGTRKVFLSIADSTIAKFDELVREDAER